MIERMLNDDLVVRFADLIDLRGVQRIYKSATVRQVFDIISYISDEEETVRQIDSGVIDGVAIGEEISVDEVVIDEEIST